MSQLEDYANKSKQRNENVRKRLLDSGTILTSHKLAALLLSLPDLPVAANGNLMATIGRLQKYGMRENSEMSKDLIHQSMDDLFTHATQYAAKYGGFKTNAQIELMKRAAARLSGSGDEAGNADAISRIEASVDLLMKGKGESK